MSSYLLSYDLNTLGDLFPQLQSFIKEHKLISQWSNPYPGLFFLKSDAEFPSIVATFAEFFAGKVFHVVCPIESAKVGGILYSHIWDWLNAPPTNTLGGLLGFVQQQER